MTLLALDMFSVFQVASGEPHSYMAIKALHFAAFSEESRKLLVRTCSNNSAIIFFALHFDMR